MKRIVIVGGVAGGGTAAARARRQNEHAEITVIEKGPYVSFANCGLPYYIAGIIKNRSDLLLQTPESFKSRYNVDVRINSEAVSIDRDNTRITVRDDAGRTYELAYDTLVLTQGGTPIKPPIPGIELPHVFTLWTVPDVDAIHEFINERSPQSATVVGAGFIGIEMAEALTERGISVTVVERLPQVMPNLDAETAARVAAHLGEHGVRVIVDASVESISEKAVNVSGGQTVPSDMVLMSVGVSPTVSLAKDAGLVIGSTGAVEVDDHMRSSDPHIFCAGDMAEIRHRVTGNKARIPLAGPANRQGRIAGANAAGGDMRYDGSIGTSVVKVFDATVGSAGLSARAAREAGIEIGIAVIHRDHHAGYYPGAKQINFTLIYNRNTGEILGAQAFGYEGVDKRIDTISMAVYGKLTLSELAEVDLSYAPPYSSANDIVNMAAFVGENDRNGYASTVSADEFFSMYNGLEDVLLDVRTAGEWNAGHIDGALHIPVDELRDRIDEIPAGKRVFVHCHVGFRAHVAVRLIKQRGYATVYNVTGGWLSMKIAKGFPHGVEKEE